MNNKLHSSLRLLLASLLLSAAFSVTAEAQNSNGQPAISPGASGSLSAAASSPKSSSTVNGSPASASDYSLEHHRNEFGVWGASSFELPSALGDSHDTKYPFMLGLRYGRVLFISKAVAFEYTADFVPVAVVSQPKIPSLSGSGRDHIYGIGVVPVGLKFIFRPNSRIKPYVEASSGPFYFSSPVPVPNATHFNFFSAADLGLQIHISEKRTVSFGYKIGHTSNAGISDVNPGFNSSSIFFGFSVFK